MSVVPYLQCTALRADGRHDCCRPVPTAVSVLTNVFCNGCIVRRGDGTDMYRERFDTGYLLFYFDISFCPLMTKCNMKNSGLFL